MNRNVPLIHEGIDELRHLLKREKDSRLKIRIHMLYLFRSGLARFRKKVTSSPEINPIERL